MAREVEDGLMEEKNGDTNQPPPADRPAHVAFDRARTLLGSGDTEGAEQAAAQALAEEEDFIPALELGGVLACQLRKFDVGIARLRKLNELVPDHPGALFNLGNALVSRGSYEEGLGLLERADEIAPGNPNVAVARGIALRNLGQVNKAIDTLEGVLAAAPNHLAALNSLGSAYAQAGVFDKASNTFQRAVRLSPRSLELRLNAANMLLELGDYRTAADEFRAALTVDARHPDSRVGLAMALAGLGDNEEAIYHLRKALKADPAHRRALFTYIDLLLAANRDKEAQEALNNAPDDINFHFLALRAARRLGDKEQLAKHVERALGTAIPDELAPRYLAETGKALDGLERYDEAWECFVRANKAATRVLPPQAGHDFLKRAQAAATWMEAQPQELDHPETDSPAPVFLLGFPRSGSASLAHLLAAHPDLYVSSERPLLRRLADSVQGDHTHFTDGLDALDAAQIDKLRERYWEGFGDRPANRTPIDPMPWNVVYLPLIQRLFPNATILHAVREPKDAVPDAFMEPYALNSATANLLTLEGAAELYAAMHRIRPLGLRTVECRFEALTSNPQEMMNTLCQALGIAPRTVPGNLPDLRRRAGLHLRYATPVKTIAEKLSPAATDLGYL